ncbi:unnamed protein product [Mytilus edulis]|uniref:Uncharacterized protein n=1 Tax=Mytilus edulis TaxID=6550 RepID=A0A8S3UGS2_MYTED|nr:unnamed protein product [Mytilus edulis]
MNMLILLTILQIVSSNVAYNFTCPSSAHWKIRAKSLCEPPRNYTCLFDVTFRVNVYRERCSRPRILAEGYKYVFQPNLNRATCNIKCYDDEIDKKSLLRRYKFNNSRTIKIIEFDNFKYNLNYPTNKYRIKAAASIGILLLSYFAVCIIFHKLMTRWIQFRNILPDAINQLSEEDKIRYNTLMQSSETEKEINDDKVSRITRALISNAEDRNTQNMQVDETNNMNIRQGDEKSTYNKDITTNKKVSQENSDDTTESLVMPEDSTNKALINLDNKEVTNESSSLVMPEDFTTDDKINLDNKQNESSLLVMPEDLMSHVFSKSTVNAPFNIYALCELWDFAGQKEFYATHQAFLTSSAVYLVVADMKDDISKQGLGQCFADFQNIGEYVDFWFDSIHCHRTADKRARTMHFDPPVLLVFTGKDKYKEEHNVGNIIFFENIPDLIILNPQWLADAFRCLVSDRIDDSGLHHREDWTLFTRQGKLSESLITELFKSKDGSQFSGQKNNLHKVMEKLDILVKIENSSYYIMPSQMPSSKFEDVFRNVGILTKNCKRTSWLCFKFKFLPPSFFNHISAWFIKQYIPSKVDSDDSSVALYRGICVFDIDISGCEKILVTMSTDTIALQVVSFSEQDGFGSMCSGIHREVTQLIEDIKERYNVNISFKLHFKCSDGYYFKDTFEYENLIIEKKCFCIQHKQMHRSDQILSPWMNNEVKEIPDRTKINTTQDDQNPENKPSKEDVQDQTSVKTNLPVSVNLRKQLNIKQSTNENLFITSCIKTGNTLVFTDCHNNRLIICNSDGTDIHHIPLSYKPYYITEIDSNTVAVSCLYDRTILIINISTRSVTSTINTSGYCYGISYNDNNLYVVIDKSIIHVMDLTGKVIRTIPVPTYGIYDITVDRDRLICIDFTSSIYCCSLDGKVMWKFKKDEFQDLTSVTTDNDKNVYVTSYKTNTVIVISDDGKHHKELLTKSDGLDWPRGIYFDKKENILLVCNERNGKAFLFEVKKNKNKHE